MTTIFRRLLNARAASQYDKVSQRNFFCVLFFNNLQDFQNFGKLLGLVNLPICFGGEKDSGAV